MKTLREQVLESGGKLYREPIEVPEWGTGPFYVTVMSGIDRDAFESRRTKDGEFDRHNFRARIVVKTLVGEDGVRIFTDADEFELGRTNSLPLSRVAEIAIRLNGLGADGIESAEKNSGQADGTAS